MNIRPLDIKDPYEYERIKDIFKKQGFEYDFPGPSEFIDIQVLVDDKDNILMALAAKKIVSYYLLVDNDSIRENKLSPSWKWAWFKKLLLYSFKVVKKLGFNQVTAWLPPEIDRSFGRRIKSLGAKQYIWNNYARELTDIDPDIE